MSTKNQLALSNKASQNNVKTKKLTKSQLKENKEVFISSNDIHAQLMQWAHAGTKEALENLDKFIQEEKDENLRSYAEIARDEAEYFYYAPDTKQEEKDFLLARMIWRRQEYVWELEGKADSARLKLTELNIKRQVHQKLMQNLKDKTKKEEWQYNFSEDYYTMIKGRLEEFENEIAYDTAWLEQARKMVKTKKYQAPRVHIFDHIHFDGDGFSIWEDEDKIKADNDEAEEQGGLHDYLPQLIEPTDDAEELD